MLRDGLLNWRDLLLTLMHGMLAGRPRTFADLINFLIVHVCQPSGRDRACRDTPQTGQLPK
jgi:hypothetical protein